MKQKYGGLFQDELSYEKSLKKRARLVSSSSELSMETTNRTFSSFSNSHIHEFSEEQPCREDSFHRHPLYYKQCSTCGLRITFEKIDSSE